MSSSQSYASRLSHYTNKGDLNLTPCPDPPLSTLHKCRHLASLIRAHTPVVLHTGAGLSTAAGIRDFRGPNGVWTKQAGLSREGLDADVEACSFEEAAPTLAHMVITAMYHAGLIHYVVTQNVDGLHRRSRFPRQALSELHGSLFVDWCALCETEYERETETNTVGFCPVGRKCTQCGAQLTDKALDWEDALPSRDLEMAKRLSRDAGLNVIVGSSCQMNPARRLPFSGKGRSVIVNLSETEFDERCVMTVRAEADVVFAFLAKELGVRVGSYERVREVVMRRCGERVHMRVVMDGVERRKVIGGIEKIVYRMGSECKEVAGGGYDAVIGHGTVDVEVHAEGGVILWKMAADGTVRRKVVAQRKEYDQIAHERVESLKLQAREWRGKKRKRATASEWEPRKWFARSEKRGWQLCVMCGVKVWARRNQREKHAMECVNR